MTNGQTPSDQPRQYSDFYREVGEETFAKIVRGFYARVPDDDILGPMYPDDDWEGAERRLRMFLEQYWGGPTTYSEQRGHPRLRMRHVPYRVDRAAHDAWLGNMLAAVDTIDSGTLDDAHREALVDYLTRAAAMLVNTPDAV